MKGGAFVGEIAYTACECSPSRGVRHVDAQQHDGDSAGLHP
jgi:hypothetical protein